MSRDKVESKKKSSRRDADSGASAPAPAGSRAASDDADQLSGRAAEESEANGSPSARDSEVSASSEPAPAERTLSALEDELSRVHAESEEKHGLYLRALAELDNVRKRSARELGERTRRAREEVLASFLSAIDDVERALEALDGQGKDSGAQAIVDGVRLIHGRLLEILGRYEVRPMDAVGHEFDPRFHEAVMSIEDAEHEAGHVAQVLQKGYWIGDHVLRPARVAVARDADRAASAAESVATNEADEAAASDGVDLNGEPNDPSAAEAPNGARDA